MRVLPIPPSVYSIPSSSWRIARDPDVPPLPRTLPEDRFLILGWYHIMDVARKVVGVGSVGTRCDVALLMAGEHDPMLLQFKEALPSVLDPYVRDFRPRHRSRAPKYLCLDSARALLGIGFPSPSLARAPMRDSRRRVAQAR